MSLLDQAKADIETITSDPDGFTRSIVLTAPTDETVTIYGLHSKHHLGIDTDGNRVNSKNPHISVAEKFLIDAEYPVRGSTGEVNLSGHKVSVADSTGTVCNYVIREWYPNETTGLIVCILGDFE